MRIKSELTDDFYGKGFTSETDPFGRRDLAERLTRLYVNLAHGTVSILDGRWGSGKSVFVRQWMHHLESQGVPCIYIDAFAMDYVESPFRAMAAAFVREAKAAREYDEATYNHFLKSIARAAKIIAAPAAKMAVKAISLGVIGSVEADELKHAADELASGLGDMSEASVKAMLEEQAGDEANFNALRQSLAALPNLLAKKLGSRQEISDSIRSLSSPSLVVMVDELDRCRPDFALGVLETLKHFFRAERVHFVLVTNLAHLTLSVQKRYGVAEAAAEYIQKFYDFLIPFEERPLDKRTTNAGLHTKRLLDSMLPGANTRDGDDLIDDTVRIVSAYDLSLRQAEQIVANVVLAQIDFNINTFRPGMLIAFLAAIKAQDPSLFAEIKRSRLDFNQIRVFLEKGAWGNDSLGNRIVSLIRFFSDPSVNESEGEFAHYRSWMGQYYFEDRLDTLPYLANAVIDRFG